MSRIVSYTVGLVLALVLTVTAFSLTFAHTNDAAGGLPSTWLIAAILTLAFVQLLVQLVFFLHLGRNKTARWNTLAFGTTFAGILVVVLASVWIMYHLNYNMTPTEQTNYINDQSTF
ncbi:MAG TPA: cytochrome o ubiquinol oxidase subunit IV [Candidatus Saccharimonadales bacterium]|nr:cytochrome o ubiquinol oxidase subunit IV [Candidatus Saccharimonadales bacterium]